MNHVLFIRKYLFIINVHIWKTKNKKKKIKKKLNLK